MVFIEADSYESETYNVTYDFKAENAPPQNYTTQM